jgi:hypothetical protein
VYPLNGATVKLIVFSFSFSFLCSFLFSGYQVLYKSRCDNKLNEITERASADKREVFSKM